MRVSSLSKTYKPKSGEVKALDSLSFDLPESGMVFVLGKSGSGKSTLLNLLSGLDDADNGGVIEVGGKNIVKCSAKERDGYRNSCCGFVFQEYNLIPELNVKENIKLSCQLHGEKNSDEKVEHALERVELSGFGVRRVTELSGGQKQRVAIARAIVKDPKIVFADEPTGALDETTGESIFELLKEIAKDRLVIVVSHDREFATKYGDRTIELANGKIISDSDSGYVCDEQVQVEFQKPKLPTKTAAKIGCANFKFHPIRLVATILLSVIAFAFLGICLNVATANPRANYIRAVLDSDMEYAVVYRQKKVYMSDEFAFDKLFGGDNYLWDETNISLDDAEALGKVSGAAYCIDSDVIHDFQEAFGMPIDDMLYLVKDRPEEFSITASGCMYLDEGACAELGYAIVGRLPQNENEIAINENILNSFTVAGLYEDGIKYTVDSAEEMIGHKLPMPYVDEDGIKYGGGGLVNKTVVGVVNTGCSRECRNTHINDPKHLHDKIYAHKEYTGKYAFALCKIDENFEKFANYVFDSEDGENRYFIGNNLGYYIAEDNFTFVKFLCMYGSIIFTVAALIMLTNFIGTSIRRQMKGIGIFSAMGADFRSLIKIYGSSTAIICAIVYGFALALTAIFIPIVNNLLIKWSDAAFTLLSFNPMLIGVLLAAAVVCGLLGLVLPLVRIRKLNPVDAIGRGQIK